MRSKSAMILNKHVQNQRLGSLSRRKQLILKSRRAITCLLFSHSKETILKPRKQTLWNTISQDAKEHFCLYSLFFFDINNVLTLNYNHQSSDSSLLAPMDFLGYQEVTYLCFLLRQKKKGVISLPSSMMEEATVNPLQKQKNCHQEICMTYRRS